jgi:rhamnulose-1-phosphate aldolase/alcohol dehydrogenase
MTGKPVSVLWVKGSGGDLRTSTRENFSSLYMDLLFDLEARYTAEPHRGAKTPVEDAMVGMYPHCTFNLNPRAASIDTPLHAYLPEAFVDHTHPNAAISVAASKNSQKLTREIYGDDVVWTPWQRPGFDLGLILRDIVREHPKAKGIILGQHGLINWAADDKAVYELSLELIEKAARYIDAHDRGEKTFGGARYQSLAPEKRDATWAAILPWLRGQVSRQRRLVGTLQSDETILRFVNSIDAPRLAEVGTSCPDHFLRTKIKPMYVPWDPQKQTAADLKRLIASGLESYRADYAAYYQKCRRPDSPAMRDANPTVVLIPGLGMVAWGKDKSESRVTAEFYNCAVDVMRGSEAIDQYVALPQQEAFDIEYWLLEEAKLKRMPAEKELARKIIVVVGSGSGIGREVARRISKEGAHVVCADLNLESAQQTADGILATTGAGIGVSGTGISACGPAIAVKCDITNRAGIRKMLDEAILAYGGIDAIAITAGITVPSDTTGHIPDQKWDLTYSINVIGPYLLADEAARTLVEQNLPATIVMTTSANAVVAKRGMLAYDTSKAAASHLVRELAVELAPLVRVNGVAPATVVEGSSMFPRDRVISSLTKYNVPFAETDSTETLRQKLATFYAGRNLTHTTITPADQAEAFFLLLGERLSRTTGQIIAVDGGLAEAFLR